MFEECSGREWGSISKRDGSRSIEVGMGVLSSIRLFCKDLEYGIVGHLRGCISSRDADLTS